jgi:hypothetical protein
VSTQINLSGSKSRNQWKRTFGLKSVAAQDIFPGVPKANSTGTSLLRANVRI